MNNSHDPLTVLHGDELPVQPDPAFAARLRARLESALCSLPNRTEGVVMSGTDTAIAELNEPAPNPAASAAPRPAALPYLVRRATRARPSPGTSTRSARRWSASRSRWTTAASGTPSWQIGDGVLYLADEYPEIGLKAPAPQAISVSLMLHVADTDADAGTGRENAAPTCSGSPTRTTARATPPSSTRSGTGGCSADR